MKNCLILGSGRSGTSMVAGTLAAAGYFMGEQLYKPRESNPKGFFESPDINGINEDLLARVVPRRPFLLGRWLRRELPAPRQRWLARVPLDVKVCGTPSLAKRIEVVVGHEPYCFKDPRFCYTLPVWRPFLSGTVFVCVFRHPAATANSIVKECKDAPYLHSLYMDFDIAVEVWTLMHQHILHTHRHEGDWLFIHYDQVLRGEGLKRLEQHLDIRVDRDFPDKTLRRSSGAAAVPSQVEDVYKELCVLADYDPA